ncbi:MAG TPA: hypothetical protein VF796_02730 [Humisphaera sp.]
MYAAAVQSASEHLFLRRHLHQVTRLGFSVGDRQADFYAAEFRHSLYAALAWTDGDGNWAAGRWLLLPHAEAEVTSPPSPLDLEYFQGNGALPSFATTVDRLAQTAPAGTCEAPASDDLSDAVKRAVITLQSRPTWDDDVIVERLFRHGFDRRRANRLVQFVPIAFCRFLIRHSGVVCDPHYVPMTADGTPLEQRPLASEPIFRAAVAHCEEVEAFGVSRRYFDLVAARSGGYKALASLSQERGSVEGLELGPPNVPEL